MPIDPGSSEHMLFMAEIGMTAQAAGGIDNGLNSILAALLADRPSAGFSFELASSFIFTARSVEQRIEMINKCFYSLFRKESQLPKRDNSRRAFDYMDTLKNKIFSSLISEKWIRNLAAHGNITLSDDKPRLIPPIFDRIALDKLVRRDSQYSRGLDIDQLKECSKRLSQSTKMLFLLGISIKDFKQTFSVDNQDFLGSINELSAKLGIKPLHLHDPRDGPPLRTRR